MPRETQRVIGQLKGVIERASRALVLDIHARLTRTTPVDTGWARSNWLPSVTEPNFKAAGSKENVSNATANAGIGSVLSWRLGQGQLFITNNVPYIVDLNNGSSPQAPAGFVEMAVQASIAQVRNRRF